MATELLVPSQTYLASGIHIGMKQKSQHMRRFVYKIRPDGLAVMNLQMIDERLRIAAGFLGRAKNIMVVGRKNIAHTAIEKFGEAVGGRVVKGRFMPGTLTNPQYKSFFEADAIVVVDPLYDHQVMDEATTARVPVVGVCGTSNETNRIDLVIPANNKSAKSISVLFWVLAREILKSRGDVQKDEDFAYKISDFMKEGSFEEPSVAVSASEQQAAKSPRRGRRTTRRK
ncbi:MAG: 30S ribosomal protein S2 [Candidatus Aenigmatarchaeota archaeon]